MSDKSLLLSLTKELAEVRSKLGELDARVSAEGGKRTSRAKRSFADILEFDDETRQLITEVARLGRATLRRLAERLERTEADVLALVKRLIEDGYLKQGKSKDDVVYSLTVALRRPRRAPEGLWASLAGKVDPDS